MWSFECGGDVVAVQQRRWDRREETRGATRKRTVKRTEETQKKTKRDLACTSKESQKAPTGTEEIQTIIAAVLRSLVMSMTKDRLLVSNWIRICTTPISKSFSKAFSVLQRHCTQQFHLKSKKQKRSSNEANRCCASLKERNRSRKTR